MKKTIEIIFLIIIVLFVLWLTAFFLRDKNEFFCKVSFGELRSTNFSDVITLNENTYNKKCVGTWIVDKFGN
ncbi:hypothetical protein JW758_06320 [Candidatus Peregrinibacteria bacterium]|nr:hypothetical protein [Candidatus Peregrinibacteria bacterium]